MKTLILSILLLGTFVNRELHARPYRYYLDPNQAEQILGAIVLRPRLDEDSWLKLLQYQKNDMYTVQKGDTLWTISKIRFRDPFLWRKLWEVNQWITNPHLLDVGKALAYYRKSQDESVKKIPLVKLRPESSGNYGDIDNDIVLNRTLKARHRVKYFVAEDEEMVGEISGAYTETKVLREFHDLYAFIYEDSKVKMGQRYAIAREEMVLRDRTLAGTPVIGKLMQIVGEVKLLSRGEHLVKIEILSLQAPMYRGDKIVTLPKVASDSILENPPGQLTVKVVMGEEPEHQLLKQGHLVVLNRGRVDGIKEGYYFRIFKDTDPQTEDTAGVEPDFKGEIRVVYTGKITSIGYITRNSQPISLGDTGLPFKSFPERPAAPMKETQTFELD